MSVLECARNGCNNIMCNRLSNMHGYICNSCFDELVGTGPRTNIEWFMQSEKPQVSEEESTARYNAAFPSMRDTDEEDY